jgi:hypothetical protein
MKHTLFIGVLCAVLVHSIPILGGENTKLLEIRDNSLINPNNEKAGEPFYILLPPKSIEATAHQKKSIPMYNIRYDVGDQNFKIFNFYDENVNTYNDFLKESYYKQILLRMEDLPGKKYIILFENGLIQGFNCSHKDKEVDVEFLNGIQSLNDYCDQNAAMCYFVLASVKRTFMRDFYRKPFLIQLSMASATGIIIGSVLILLVELIGYKK